MTSINTSSYLVSLFGSSATTTDTSSLLVDYYNAKAGITGAAATANTAATTTGSPTGSSQAPSAPWSSGSDMPTESELVTKVMKGQDFINSAWVTSDVVGASEDYQKLFTLYQGLAALEGIAEAAQAKNVTATQLAGYQRRFLQGLEEIQAYIEETGFDHVALTQGVVSDEAESEVASARTDPTYTAEAIHSGSTTTAVKAFSGEVQFSMTVKRTGTAEPFVIDFDLNEMGDSPRTMSNVVSYMNQKLDAAGVDTRFAIKTTPAVAETMVINGKTVTLSSGQPSYGLQIKGVSFEAVTFGATQTADSVYVAQSTGDPTQVPDEDEAEDEEADEPVTSSLVKFQADGSGLGDPIAKVGDLYYAGEAQSTTLSDAVVNIAAGTTSDGNTVPSEALAVASGPDGSVYVLANVDTTVDGQTIKGEQDVALMKYDSAGNLVYTRTLGAADTASGYALAVSADGKVAIAGSVTGALNIDNPTTTTNAYGLPVATGVADSTAGLNGTSATTTDSFVTVLDGDGNELWSQRGTAKAEDEALSVTFGEDGAVYVGGRTKSVVTGSGATQQGGWDAYVTGYSAQGKTLFSVATGTAASDATAQMAVDGDTLYVAAVEGGNAVLRAYDVSSGKAVLSDSRNLGGLGGGTITGLAIYDGKAYVGGSSGSGGLLGDEAEVTSAYSGNQDAFALSISTDFGDTSADKVAFYGGAGVEKNAQAQFSQGKAWIAGSTTGAIAGTTQVGSGTVTGSTTVETDGYLARLNIDTGEVEYQKRYTGADSVVNVHAIAVSSSSSSVLDRLGLPLGTIDYTESNTLAAASSVRAGDKFYLVDPGSGVKKTITIEAGETLKTLAKKIERASGYKLDASVEKVVGKQLENLVITPSDGTSSMMLVAGPAGQDALKGLGLAAGLITSESEDGAAYDAVTGQKQMGLGFDASLNLSSTASIAAALESLQATMKQVQSVYSYLKYGDPQEADSKQVGKTGGTVPTYLTDQIANYQAALSRLTGGG